MIESTKYNYILSPQFSVVQLAIKFANCVFPDFSLSLSLSLSSKSRKVEIQRYFFKGKSSFW